MSPALAAPRLHLDIPRAQQTMMHRAASGDDAGGLCC
jgi:hypothetical protein